MKLFKAIIVLMFTLMTITGALGALEATDLTREVDFSGFDDDEKEFTFTHQVTIKNTGSGSESISLSLEDIEKDYTAKLSQTSVTLEAGASKKVSISVEAPVEEGTTYATLKANSESFSLKTQPQLMVEIEEIDVYVQGSRETSIDNDKDSVSDISPGDEIEFKFQIQNLFDDDYRYGDVDGTITIELDDSDFGKDIDEEIDFSLDAGDDDNSLSITFDVPLDADEATYDVEVKLEVEDENDITYEQEWTVELDVERERDDVRIDQVSLSKEIVTCSPRDTTLTTRIRNYGSDDQDRLRVRVESDNLNLVASKDFELEEGSSDDNNELLSFPLSISEDAATGSYTVSVTLYRDYDEPADRDTVTLQIRDCATAQPKPTPVITPPTTQVTQQPAQPTPSQPVAQPAQPNNGSFLRSVEVPFENTNLFLILMIIGIVLIAVVIALLGRVVF